MTKSSTEQRRKNIIWIFFISITDWQSIENFDVFTVMNSSELYSRSSLAQRTNLEKGPHYLLISARAIAWSRLLQVHVNVKGICVGGVTILIWPKPKHCQKLAKEVCIQFHLQAHLHKCKQGWQVQFSKGQIFQSSKNFDVGES